MNCKNCGNSNNNGTNFCTRKCRTSWIKVHEVKGAKKRYRNHDRNLMQFGIASSALDKNSIGVGVGR